MKTMALFEPLKIKRVLLIRLSALGDLLHALPVLRALKHWRPDLQIDWLIEDRFSSLLRNVSELDEIQIIPRKRWKEKRSWVKTIRDAGKIRKQLRQKNYEVSIDLQGLTKSGIWPWLAGVPARIGFGDEDSREMNRWFTNLKIEPDPRKNHVIDRNLALLEPFGISNPKVDFSLPLDEPAREKILKSLSSRNLKGKPLALIQPGAGWKTKRWPPEYYAQVGDFLVRNKGFELRVLWGPGEKELAESVLQGMKEHGSLAPETDLLELVELIRLSEVFIGGDTGPMHFAAALGIPTIAIFGASDPTRNGPYGENHLVLHHDIECRPCWKTTCDHLKCLQDLTPENIIPKIEAYLKKE